jgi:hypothetical protein
MRVPLEMVFYLFIVKEEHMRILFWFFMSFMCIGRSTQIVVLRSYCFWFHSISSYFRFFICVKVDLEKKNIFLETMRKIVFLNVNLPSSAVVVTEGWHEPTLTSFRFVFFYLYRFHRLISTLFQRSWNSLPSKGGNSNLNMMHGGNNLSGFNTSHQYDFLFCSIPSKKMSLLKLPCQAIFVKEF